MTVNHISISMDICYKKAFYICITFSNYIFIFCSLVTLFVILNGLTCICNLIKILNFEIHSFLFYFISYLVLLVCQKRLAPTVTYNSIQYAITRKTNWSSSFCMLERERKRERGRERETILSCNKFCVCEHTPTFPLIKDLSNLY